MDIKNSEKIFSYLENIHQRYEEISKKLADPEIITNPQTIKTLSKELVSLKPLIKKYLELKKLFKQIRDAKELLNTSDDHDLATLAEEELANLNRNKAKLELDIQSLMVTNDDENKRNVFLEIRSGAGGDEASLFAADLLRMYMRYAEQKGWKAEIISTTYSAIGGIKEIILYIKGENVNRFLKFESGVHRVQRVPVTESSGRIHTSTVTIAVLPEAEDVEVDINPKDIRIDTFTASGPGGQHVNRTESAIRITHFQTGITVTCQDEKSQHKNKDKAIKVLKARLFEHEKKKQDDNISKNRKSQVGTGERSEKIRTYNFPQSRITDHRINNQNYNIETVLNGNMESMISELIEKETQDLIEEKLKSIIA